MAADSPERYAEIYVHRFFPPDARLALKPQGEHRAEALARYVEGLRLEGQKDAEGARKAFRRVLELDPAAVALAAKIAGLEAVLGDPEAGEKVLVKTREANPQAPGASLALAEYLRTFLGEDSDAKERSLQVMKEAYAAFPRNAAVVSQYLRYLIQENKREDALAVLNAATALSDGDASYYLALGRVATQLLPVSRNKDSEPVALNAIFEKALAKGGEDPDIQDQVAAFYLASRQFDKARALYEKMVEKHSDRLDIRQKLARVLGAAGDEAGALAMLESILVIDPDEVETRRELGRRYRQAAQEAATQKDMEKAMALVEKATGHLQAALRSASGSAREFSEVAELLINTRKPKEALPLLDRAAHLYPDDLNICLLQSRAYSAAEDWKNSVVAFEKAERLATLSLPATLSDRFYFSFGAARERSGDVDGAAVLFRRSLELLTKSDANLEDEDNRRFAAQVYNYLGYMWIEKDMKIPESGELIKKAFQLDPTSGAIMDSVGWYYFKKGDYQEALEMLQKSARHMEENDPVVFDHIAQALFKLGRKAEAVEHMKQAVALDPNSEELKKRLEEFETTEPPAPPAKPEGEKEGEGQPAGAAPTPEAKPPAEPKGDKAPAPTSPGSAQ